MLDSLHFEQGIITNVFDTPGLNINVLAYTIAPNISALPLPNKRKQIIFIKYLLMEHISY